MNYRLCSYASRQQLAKVGCYSKFQFPFQVYRLFSENLTNLYVCKEREMKDFLLHSPFGDVILPKERTLPELLLAKAKEHASNGKTARITDTITGESLDFASFDKVTQSVASALYKRGFRTGDVAIYMMYDIVKLHIFYTGVWRANGVPRACYPEDDKKTLLDRVEESRAGWIYCEPEMAEMCLSVANQIYWDVDIIVNGHAEGCLSIYDMMDDDGSDMPKLSLKPDDPSIIFSTSGTTGASKGAVLTHDALIRQIYTMGGDGRPFDHEHVNLIITKGTHMSGCQIPAFGLINGNHFLVMRSIRADHVFEAIRKYQPRHIFAFPAMLVALVNHPEAANYDFSCVKWATTGGAPMTSAIEKIILTIPSIDNVYNIFGLTEVGAVLSTIDFNSDKTSQDCKIPGLPENSVGKLMRGVSAQFRHIETGKILGANETGELCIRCKGMFSQYYKNQEATDDSILDGFFRTGDIGYYDENQFVFLVDRAKEIFKYFGNHVSPTEIENVINDHPAVGEVCVVGVPEPLGGHVPRAFCVILKDYPCTPKEVVDFANSQLPDFKQLRGGVYFVEQLPKGKTGKVTRQLVEKIEINGLNFAY